MSNEYTIIEKIKNLFARPEAEVSDLELMNQLTEAGVEIPAAATREILTDLLNAELSKRENTPTQTDAPAVDKTGAAQNVPGVEDGTPGKEITDPKEVENLNAQVSENVENTECEFVKTLDHPRHKLLAKMICEEASEEELKKANFGAIQVAEMKAKMEGKDCGCN